MRDKIDWENLAPLPRKRADRGADRETLAEIRFTRQKAKHKGRCHITNQKRRQIAQEKVRVGKVKQAKVVKRIGAYVDQVRAYWRGEIEQHPEKPA